jgi:hypothetical protein
MDTVSNKPKGFMTLKEFAKRSERDFRTITRWLADGKIVGVYDAYANKWLVSEAEFERVHTYGVQDGRRKA